MCGSFSTCDMLTKGAIRSCRIDSPVAETVALAYWDAETETYAYWDPIFDEDRRLPGRRSHDYPNQMVFALVEERNVLKETQHNLENDQEQVQGQLRQV